LTQLRGINGGGDEEMVANLLLPGKAVMRDLRPKVRTDSLRIVAVLLLAEALCGAFSLRSACSGTTGSTQYVHTYVLYTHVILCSSAPLARLVLPKLRAPGERLMDLHSTRSPTSSPPSAIRPGLATTLCALYCDRFGDPESSVTEFRGETTATPPTRLP